jgi:hypothetical protein
MPVRPLFIDLTFSLQRRFSEEEILKKTPLPQKHTPPPPLYFYMIFYHDPPSLTPSPLFLTLTQRSFAEEEMFQTPPLPVRFSCNSLPKRRYLHYYTLQKLFFAPKMTQNDVFHHSFCIILIYIKI